MLTQEDEETVAIKPKAEEKKKEIKKTRKDEGAEKAEEAVNLLLKSGTERKAAEEAARKRVAELSVKVRKWVVKVLRKEQACREVLTGILRQERQPEPADMELLILADVL